jgi:hypothetical protein
MLIGLVGVENRVGVAAPPVTVTVNKSAGQADPTSATPILFDLVFSEPVTGVTFSDVFFTGSTAGGTLTCSISGGPTSYVASVTGMTTNGNVAVVLPAAAALSVASSTPSQASTPIDNVVQWIAPSSAAWYTLFDLTLSSDSNGWGDYCLAQYIAPAAYDAGAPATGTKLRFTVQTGSTVGINFSGSYAGHNATSGDVVDFDGTQIGVLWGGSLSGTRGVGTHLSDEMTYAFNKTKGLVFRMRFNSPGGGDSNVKTQVPLTNFQKTFAIDGADSYVGLTDIPVDGASFDVMSSGVYLIKKIEVYG